MRKFVNNFFSIAFLFAYAPVAALALQGGDSGKIGIQSIVPQLHNDSLAVSAKFVNLFSNKIVGTIQSGLPSIIQVEIKLLESNRKQIARKLISKSIEYDIWEEKYKISENGLAHAYSDFSKVKKMCTEIHAEDLLFKTQMKTGKAYIIQVRVGIIPISAHQAGKVTDWLMDPNQTEEAVASQNRTTGFELNINKLVSFFVSKKKGSKYISRWYSSKPFQPNELVP